MTIKTISKNVDSSGRFSRDFFSEVLSLNTGVFIFAVIAQCSLLVVY